MGIGISRIAKIAGVGGLLAATALAPGSPAGAGEPGGFIRVYIDVVGTATFNALDYLNGVDAELYDEMGEEQIGRIASTCIQSSVLGDADSASTSYYCYSVRNGTYDLGLEPMETPDGIYIDAECDVDVPANERFSDPAVQAMISGSDDSQACYIYVAPATDVYVDKIVDDDRADPAVPGDFELELYDDEGTLIDTARDTDAGTCSAFDLSAACAVFEAVPPGSYTLGESSVQGYGATTVGCGRAYERVVLEVFPNGAGDFEHDLNFSTRCEITNAYGEAGVRVSKMVDNSSGGGTAGAGTFTIELYDDTMTKVFEGVCPADGVDCIDTVLPVGTYFVGESGPSGYLASVICDVTDGPGPAIVTLPERGFDEIIADANGEFELTLGGSADCTVTNAAPATTTTTTTVAATTTVVAATTTTVAATTTVVAATTTVTPTTALDAAVATLPATGSSGGANQSMIVAALAMLALGGGLLLVRRAT